MEKKQIFGKKSQCRQTERGDPLGFLKTQSVVKYQRNLKGPFGEKKIIEKKSHNTEKLKGDPLGVFNLHSVAKHQKSEGEIFFLIFGKKSHKAEKKQKGGTLWDFSTSILSQNSKKNEGGPFGEKVFPKKILQCRKKLKGGPFGLARYGMLRGKTGKTFLVQFARQNGAIWCNNIL